MPDSIPTTEHIAEARACWLAFAEFPTYIRAEKAIQCIARALAAAEARGFERGRAAGPAPYVDPLADEAGNRHHKDGSRCTDAYCRRAHALPMRHKEPR